MLRDGFAMHPHLQINEEILPDEWKMNKSRCSKKSLCAAL